MKMRIRCTGGREIQHRLRMLPAEVAGEPMREAALAGAEVIREEAKQNALKHKRTGTLANDIHSEIAREVVGHIVTVHIGPGKEGWYGRLVEFGHAYVPPGKTREARRARKAGTLEQHFGMVPPHPWLRPAFEAKRRQAREVMADELRRRLKRWRWKRT